MVSTLMPGSCFMTDETRPYPPIASIEGIIYSNYVRYGRLDQLISHAFSNSNATSVNIYIDMYGMMRTMFSRSYRTIMDDYTAYTSGIINMCGHYRAYFKNLGVSTKFYLIFGYNVCEYNRKLVNGYNSTMVDKLGTKTITKMVEDNNKLLDVFLPFIQGIYFLSTNFETSVMIDYLIRHGDNNPNIIISKDIYASQLTYLHPNTSLLKPKKFQGEDISVIIPPNDHPNYFDDFWSVYTRARAIKTYISRQYITIHPVNFSMLAAMSKFPERNLKAITSFTMANRLIYDCVGDAPIPVHTSSVIEAGRNTIIGTGKTKHCVELPEQIILNRHHAIDIRFMRPIYDESVESKMIDLKDLDDPESVRGICAEYFKSNPIDLQKL